MILLTTLFNGLAYGFLYGTTQTSGYDASWTPIQPGQAVDQLITAWGDDNDALRQAVAVLHSTPDEAAAMAARAREVVRREQGATARHASIILELLPRRAPAAPKPVV